MKDRIQQDADLAYKAHCEINGYNVSIADFTAGFLAASISGIRAESEAEAASIISNTCMRYPETVGAVVAKFLASRGLTSPLPVGDLPSQGKGRMFEAIDANDKGLSNGAYPVIFRAKYLSGDTVSNDGFATALLKDGKWHSREEGDVLYVLREVSPSPVEGLGDSIEAFKETLKADLNNAVELQEQEQNSSYHEGREGALRYALGMLDKHIQQGATASPALADLRLESLRVENQRLREQLKRLADGVYAYAHMNKAAGYNGEDDKGRERKPEDGSIYEQSLLIRKDV